MTLADLLPPDHVFGDLAAANKTELLHTLCRRAGALAMAEPRALTALVLAREALGSTGIGGGVGLPHARLPDLAAPSGFFARLRRPLDYAAIDASRVDLVFLLLTPSTDDAGHLAALALVARRLRDPAIRTALRQAKAADDMQRILVGTVPLPSR
jgi:PTS system nitrogen regulatory IIA component